MGCVSERYELNVWTFEHAVSVCTNALYSMHTKSWYSFTAACKNGLSQIPWRQPKTHKLALSQVIFRERHLVKQRLWSGFSVGLCGTAYRPKFVLMLSVSSYVSKYFVTVHFDFVRVATEVWKEKCVLVLNEYHI
jgi:hypothetical protein